MKESHLHLVLNSTVFITKGATRSIIIYENNYEFIPNDLYDVIFEFNKTKLVDIYSKIEKENHQILSEYFEYLLSKNCIFLVENPYSYPDINLYWNINFEITNSIIDFNYNLDYEKTIESLSNLGCNSIQFRFFIPSELSNVEKALSYIENSRIKSVEFIVKSYEYFSEKDISKLHKTYAKLTNVYICNSMFEKITFADKSNLRSIVFTNSVIFNELSCGIIHPNYFSTNLNVIREAQNHNTCLNRKISIDLDGNIKNCPSMAQSFGNIKDTTLEEALNKEGFKQYWNITKDDIETCKDCEFRHICTDCRAYIENPSDTNSKPLKCGYNPYTNEWEEWSNNSLKLNAINFYGMVNLLDKT